MSFLQSPILGLARVIAMEHGELRCGRIDLDGARKGDEEGDEIRALHAELLTDDGEDEVALRGGIRSALRLARAVPDAKPAARVEPAAGRPFALRIGKPGVLDQLELGPLERRRPGPGDVEIEVEAAGINFRDVLLTLGVIPGRSPPDGGRLGGSARRPPRDRVRGTNPLGRRRRRRAGRGRPRDRACRERGNDGLVP